MSEINLMDGWMDGRKFEHIKTQAAFRHGTSTIASCVILSAHLRLQHVGRDAERRTIHLRQLRLVTHRRSVAERGGRFQRRLFLCQFVRLFVRAITSERLNVGRSNLALRYIVQKSRPSSKVKVKGQRSKVKVTRDKKSKNC